MSPVDASGSNGPLSRLTHPDARIRRIALRDLGALPLGPEDLDRVVRAVEAETDADAALLGIQILAGHASARPVLERLATAAGVPVLIAHAARGAVDRIDIRTRPGWGGRLGSGTMPP